MAPSPTSSPSLSRTTSSDPRTSPGTTSISISSPSSSSSACHAGIVPPEPLELSPNPTSRLDTVNNLAGRVFLSFGQSLTSGTVPLADADPIASQSAPHDRNYYTNPTSQSTQQSQASTYYDGFRHSPPFELSSAHDLGKGVIQPGRSRSRSNLVVDTREGNHPGSAGFGITSTFDPPINAGPRTDIGVGAASSTDKLNSYLSTADTRRLGPSSRNEPPSRKTGPGGDGSGASAATSLHKAHREARYIANGRPKEGWTGIGGMLLHPAGPDTVKPENFLMKLNRLFLKDTRPGVVRPTSGPEPLIRWSKSGRYVICSGDEKALVGIIRPVFRQNHFSSFTRQLNIYGFTKRNASQIRDGGLEEFPKEFYIWQHETINASSRDSDFAEVQRRVTVKKPKKATPTSETDDEEVREQEEEAPQTIDKTDAAWPENPQFARSPTYSAYTPANLPQMPSYPDQTQYTHRDQPYQLPYYLGQNRSGVDSSVGQRQLPTPVSSSTVPSHYLSSYYPHAQPGSSHGFEAPGRYETNEGHATQHTAVDESQASGSYASQLAASAGVGSEYDVARIPHEQHHPSPFAGGLSAASPAEAMWTPPQSCDHVSVARFPGVRYLSSGYPTSLINGGTTHSRTAAKNEILHSSSSRKRGMKDSRDASRPTPPPVDNADWGRWYDVKRQRKDPE